MPSAYTTWTLNPHDPVEKYADNLWRVSGTMNNGKLQRCMVLARLSDGRILLHNPIALEDELLAEIAAWGEVAALIVPNAFHRQDARIMKDRYPAAKVYAPRGGAKKVAQVVPVDGTYDDVPSDANVRARHLSGMKDNEGVLEVRSGDALTGVFCDTLMNMAPQGFPMSFLLGPTGTLAVPRVMRWFLVKDARVLRADLERLAATDGFARIIPGHGRVLDQPADALREAAARL